MSKQFTAADADRILGLGDQFLEDWEKGIIEDGASHPQDIAEVKERREEWNALRPIMAEAPSLLAQCLHAAGEIDALIRADLDEPQCRIPADVQEYLVRVHDQLLAVAAKAEGKEG